MVNSSSVMTIPPFLSLVHEELKWNRFPVDHMEGVNHVLKAQRGGLPYKSIMADFTTIELPHRL
jgi:hypothetical protein